MIRSTYPLLFNGTFFVALLTISSIRTTTHAFRVSCGSRFPVSRRSIRLYSSEKGFNDNSRQSISLDNSTLETYRNHNNVRDQVFAALSADGGIKVTVATLRNLINDMSIQHTMTEIPMKALGRTVACALLLANGMQEEQVCQITMNGDGPLRGVLVIASGAGCVKGYVGTPMLGDFTLPEAIGKGAVQVVKNHPDWPRPYNGITAIRHGDIDRDIGIYLAESEQRSCALAAATCINGLLCTAAGGYLIEQLPGVNPDTVSKVEQNLATLVKKNGNEDLPTGLLQQGLSPVEICEIILDGLGMVPLGEIQPKQVCDCSEDRLFNALRLLPRSDVDEILEKEEQVEARCHFCGKVYRIGGEALRKRLNEADISSSADETK